MRAPLAIGAPVRARAALAAMAVALASCGTSDGGAPPCVPAMPGAASILARPAFAGLTHYKRVEYEAIRGSGFDLWADSRFDYRSILELTLVPAPAERNERLCAQALALRVALPLDDGRRGLLRDFVAAVAPAAGVDAAQLVPELERMAREGTKYRQVTAAGPVRVAAGLAPHKTRGDFLALQFAWPAPAARN